VDSVDRFVSEIGALFAERTGQEDLQRVAERHVAALIGRNAFGEEGFASRSDVVAVLRAARNRIEALTADQLAKRNVLSEIDKMLAIVGRPNLPPPSLI